MKYSPRFRANFLFLTFAILLLPRAPLSAGGILTTTTEAALRQLVRSGGLVTIAVDGSLTLTNSLVISNHTTIDATGRALALSGGGNVRLFVVNPGVTLTLKNLGILSGRQISTNRNNGGIAAPAGGAIYNNGGTVRILDSTVSNHSAVGLAGADATTVTITGNGSNGGTGETALGGAIFNNAGILFLSNCVLNANAATGGKGGNGAGAADAGNGREGGNGGSGGAGIGGAIYNFKGTVSIVASTFGTNTASSASGGVGGLGAGFFSFSGNPGATLDATGGAIFNDGGGVQILNSTFSGNTASGGAGAAGSPGISEYDGDDGERGGTGLGGGLASVAGSISVTNSTFYANIAQGGAGGVGGTGGGSGFGGDGGNGGSGGGGFGGAVYAGPNSQITLMNITASDNSAVGGLGGTGGARGTGLGDDGDNGASGVVGAGGIDATGQAAIANSILNVSLSGLNLAGRIVDLGNNITSDGSAVLSATNSLKNVDPQLGLLLANGGATLTMAITTNSPAANKANDAFCLSTDQRGFSRAGACDIGAYEAGGTLALSISKPSTNSIVLTWFGFSVETSSDIASTNWTTVTPTLVNGIRTYQTQPIGAKAFFRPVKSSL